MKKISLILFIVCIGTSLSAEVPVEIVVSDELTKEVQLDVVTVDNSLTSSDSITRSEDLVIIKELVIPEDGELDDFDLADLDFSDEEFDFLEEDLTFLDKLKMTSVFFRLQWSNLKQHVSNYKKLYGVGSVIMVLGSGWLGAYFLRNNKKDDESK